MVGFGSFDIFFQALIVVGKISGATVSGFPLDFEVFDITLKSCGLLLTFRGFQNLKNCPSTKLMISALGSVKHFLIFEQ